MTKAMRLAPPRARAVELPPEAVAKGGIAGEEVFLPYLVRLPFLSFLKSLDVADNGSTDLTSFPIYALHHNPT